MIDVFSNLEDFGDGEKPWCDLMFEISSVKKRIFSSQITISCIAQAQGKPVGFAAKVAKKDWEFVPAKDDDSIALWWGKVTLNSTGGDSDNLLQLIQEYYGFAIGGQFVDTIECQAVALEGNPTNIASGPLRTKLFFDDGHNEERYAEFYFNVDLASQLAALNEKDPEYRKPLVDWLSGAIAHESRVH